MEMVVSVFGVKPFRIGGTETFARELSLQLHQQGPKGVLRLLKWSPEQLRRFLDLPDGWLEVLEGSTDLNWSPTRTLAQIIRHHKPQILHLHFTGFLGVYRWLARLMFVKKIFFTDHTSRPAGYLPKRAPFWKRTLARIINLPVSRVICVSRYGQQCLTTLDLLPSERHELVYNAVDLSRVTQNPEKAADFRKRYGIPENNVVIVQLGGVLPEKGV